MRRDFAAYLWDIYLSADSILDYTDCLDEEVFLGVRVVQDAVQLRFQIIGEAIVQCRHHHAVEVLELGEVQGVVDFRNYLAHRYDSVSASVVWDILSNDLPILMRRVEQLLNNGGLYPPSRSR